MKFVDVNNTPYYLHPTLDLYNASQRLGFIQNTPLPMVSKPINWEISDSMDGTEVVNGSYLLNETHNRFSLIKKSNENYGETMVSPYFAEQLNKIASVPFKINLQVLSYVEKLLENKSDLLYHGFHPLTDKSNKTDAENQAVLSHNSKYLQQKEHRWCPENLCIY